MSVEAIYEFKLLERGWLNMRWKHLHKWRRNEADEVELKNTFRSPIWEEYVKEWSFAFQISKFPESQTLCGNSSDLGMPMKLFVIINISKYFLPLSNGYWFSR